MCEVHMLPIDNNESVASIVSSVCYSFLVVRCNITFVFPFEVDGRRWSARLPPRVVMVMMMMMVVVMLLLLLVPLKDVLVDQEAVMSVLMQLLREQLALMMMTAGVAAVAGVVASIVILSDERIDDRDAHVLRGALHVLKRQHKEKEQSENTNVEWL